MNSKPPAAEAEGRRAVGGRSVPGSVSSAPFEDPLAQALQARIVQAIEQAGGCLLYTSDAADE